MLHDEISRGRIRTALTAALVVMFDVGFVWTQVPAAIAHGRPWWPSVVAPVLANAVIAVLLLFAARKKLALVGRRLSWRSVWPWAAGGVLLAVALVIAALMLARAAGAA
jgi:hypothetical protein